VSLFLFFGIKEVSLPKNEHTMTFKTALFQFYELVKEQKSLMVVYMSNIACTSTVICVY